MILKKEKEIASILIKNNLKISTAESCTGGLISSRLTDISGSSEYILQNFVTYSNTAKNEILGVNLETLEKYGAVSHETAKEMAQGLINKFNCDISLSITGIAGPSGGTKEKPTGLVYIGISNSKTVKTFEYRANPLLTRRLMKMTFSSKALELLLDFLKE